MASGGSGVKQDAFAQYGTNRDTAAQSLGAVSPVYQQDLTGTSGFNPQQKADMLTAATQANGGGQAAAVGAGAEAMARDNNIGGLGASISAAARAAGDRNQEAVLGVENQNTQLENQRRAAALGGLSQIYEDANGQANANLGTAAQVRPGFWQQALLQGIGSAGQVASAYYGRNNGNG
jgi:hypothetical protein